LRLVLAVAIALTFRESLISQRNIWATVAFPAFANWLTVEEFAKLR
jgi:hypothetical protein